MEFDSSDIREEIFRNCRYATVTASIFSEAKGVVSGMQRARGLSESLGLSFSSELEDGQPVEAGAEIARMQGNPVEIVKAEELVMGTLSKLSGIATAASTARRLAGSRCRVVAGGSKKMPHEIKPLIRKAVTDGGIGVRLLDQPFAYLDKNYVRILGGVGAALRTVKPLGRNVVIQVRGETGSIESEAMEAVTGGAAVLMVDTGKREDLAAVVRTLDRNGVRSRVEVAFSGNISLDDVDDITNDDVDALDIGYAILDAPCLPMRFDVLT